MEFYFSDANLPTDKHLLKQIHRDPEGYGEISVFCTWYEQATILFTARQHMLMQNGHVDDEQSQHLVAYILPQCGFMGLMRLASLACQGLHSCSPATASLTSAALNVMVHG